MRTHQKIVQDFGASALVRALVDQGVTVNQTTPQRWADRNSIPSEYWTALVGLGASTFDELLATKPPRRRADSKSQAQAA